MMSSEALSKTDSYFRYVAVEGSGEWMGAGAELLGLDGEVEKRDFNLIMRSRDPEGNKLRCNPAMVGGVQFYDIVIASPKSVSVMAMQDERLREAHRVSVRLTAAEMEQFAACHFQNFVKPTQCLVQAAFQHSLGRPVEGTMDPQIHSHLVTANMTCDETGKWRALNALRIYKQLPNLSEFQRAVLAQQVQDLGYDLRATEKGFEIAGIPDETLAKFSRRSEQIDQSLSFKKSREMARQTRGEKLTILPAAVKAEQWARLDASEQKLLTGLQERSYEHVRYRELKPKEREAQLVEKAHRMIEDYVAPEPALRWQEWQYGESSEQGMSV
ncbi:MAG: hypothetical protein NVS1B11_36990 [Terriglobales bacterium]